MGSAIRIALALDGAARHIGGHVAAFAAGTTDEYDSGGAIRGILKATVDAGIEFDDCIGGSFKAGFLIRLLVAIGVEASRRSLVHRLFHVRIHGKEFAQGTLGGVDAGGCRIHAS